MQTVIATRIKSEPLSSVALWQHLAIPFHLYCLEPGASREPHPAIPEGEYVLRLREIGQKHAAYKARYDADKNFGPDWHRGMVEIFGVPGRTAIEFHIGNFISDSEGCSLSGTSYAVGPDGHYRVGASRVAYEMAYPILRDMILVGPTKLRLTAGVGAVA